MNPNVLTFPLRMALWEITGTEVFTGIVVTLFAVTDSALVVPDAAAVCRVLRDEEAEPVRVHSVRNVSRLRTERDAGRLAGVVVTDRVADLRPRAVSPDVLGVRA